MNKWRTLTWSRESEGRSGTEEETVWKWETAGDTDKGKSHTEKISGQNEPRPIRHWHDSPESQSAVRKGRNAVRTWAGSSFFKFTNVMARTNVNKKKTIQKKSTEPQLDFYYLWQYFKKLNQFHHETVESFTLGWLFFLCLRKFPPPALSIWRWSTLSRLSVCLFVCDHFDEATV